MFTDFKDSSTNDRAISINGDAQIIKSIKKYGNAAGYFDGNGDFLQITMDDWEMGVNNKPFTIEFWAYLLDTNSLQVFISKHGGVNAWNGSDGLNFNFYYTGTSLNFEYWNGSGPTSIQNSINLQANQWIHFAIVYDGTVTSIFVNGIKQYNSSSDNYGALPLTPTFEIGSQIGGGYPFNGYMDDLRITDGIARYTSNFTPPTQQLLGPSDPHGENVSLLLHMDGNNGEQTFIDSSPNNFTVTVNGDTYTDNSIKKFGNTSAFFNGTTDYLELPDSPAFDFGSGDFTIECWFYTTLNNWQTLIARWGGGNAFFLGVNPSNPNIELYVNNISVALGGAPQINEWNHVAAVRSGGSIKVFLNGSQIGTTYNIGYDPINSSSSLLRIGFDQNINPKFQGYIDEVRITKGFARYTSNFVPQTAPFANPILLSESDPYFNNVSLLLHMDGTQGSQSFTDSSSNNYTVTANGNAQIDTTIKQFGTGSASFDGDGDYIVIPDDTSLNFSSSDDFTIEGWIYFNSLSDGIALISKGQNGTQGWTLYYYSGTLYLGVPYVSNDISATFTPSLNTWYYLACSRQSGTVRLFIDGIKVAESSNSVTYSSVSPARIGFSHSNNYLNGYVDEIRITKGIGRYTANFTPPTVPFPNQ